MWVVPAGCGGCAAEAWLAGQSDAESVPWRSAIGCPGCSTCWLCGSANQRAVLIAFSYPSMVEYVECLLWDLDSLGRLRWLSWSFTSVLWGRREEWSGQDFWGQLGGMHGIQCARGLIRNIRLHPHCGGTSLSLSSHIVSLLLLPSPSLVPSHILHFCQPRAIGKWHMGFATWNLPLQAALYFCCKTMSEKQGLVKK